jgi:pimeloyl-ACP methyl ester carboxylesterase
VNAPLPPALTGERIELAGPAGRLSAYVAGQGSPLLLLHSVNAAASAAEVRPLYDRYRAGRTVYAPDLPGFGHSDRPDRTYTPRLMTDAIHALVGEIRRRHGDGPIDALAVSLGCEFLARAAVESAGTFRSLALVSPTGFMGGRNRRGAPGATLAMPWLYRTLRGPGWGGAVFRGLTRPGVIRYFLAKTWGSDAIDETLWHYCVATTRQPGAEYAPLHFVSGGLFSADIHDVYERLAEPVWMSHGTRGDFTDYRGKSLVAGRPNWHFDVFDAGALPYFELPDAFCSAYDRFLTNV